MIARLVLALILSAGPSVAQVLVARSGEHDQFTRLVFEIPGGMAWSIEQEQDRAFLSVGIENVRFDTGAVFARIPRTRLRDLRHPEPGQPLELILGCACDVSGFVQSGTLLVVDIRRPDTRNVDRPVRVLGQMRYRFETQDGSAPQRQGAPLGLTLPMPGPIGTRPSLPSAPDPVLANTQVTLSEQRLLEQIERAAEQGLVTTRLTFDANAPISPQNGLLGHLSAQTAIDREIDRLDQLLELANPQGNCPDPALLAIGDWGDERPFGEQIGEWRATLFGEFDRVVPLSALGLARNYLYFGFGAEAVEILALAPRDGQAHAVTWALGHIIDTSVATAPTPFDGWNGCDGPAALWAAYASDSLPPAIDTEAVLTAFSGLPAHLRSHIGPRLSRLFSDAGDGNAASAILRAVSRSNPQGVPGQSLAEAAVDDLRGRPENAEARIRDVAGTSSQDAVLALLALVDRQDRNDGAIDPGLPELIASYLFEYRGSGLSGKLAHGYSVALALSGRFDEAFDALTSAAPPASAAPEPDTRERLNHALVGRADDVTFLKFAAFQIKEGTMPKSDDVSAAMAERLLALGFPDLALSVLERSSGPAPQPARILRARSALALGLPHRAMVEVLGLSGQEVEHIRADAMKMTGDGLRAAQMWITSGQVERAEREIWLDGEGVLPDSVESSRYAQIAELAERVTTLASPSGWDVSLGATADLIEQSAALRAQIRSLDALTRQSVNTAPDPGVGNSVPERP